MVIALRIAGRAFKCVAVCCSVLQCVAVCSSAMQALHHVAACGSVLQSLEGETS